MNDRIVGDIFTPEYLAREAGRDEGEILGRQVGFRNGEYAGYRVGHADGYNEGHAEGHQVGWNAGIARANEEILKQMEFTRQHIADKATMALQLQEQQALIEQLTQQLDAMEKANASLKQANEGLRQVVTTLKMANERLQTNVAELDEKYKIRTKEYSDQIWQYNRSMVFMNAVRSTLEDLTLGDGAYAKEVREMFAHKYGQQVNSALVKGTIRVAPDKDESFAKILPKTQKFILDMLSSVARHTTNTANVPAGQHVSPRADAQESMAGEQSLGI